MSSRHSRRRVVRRTSIEPLETRQMFSAEPTGGALGGSFEHHTVSAPDFWYDTNLDRELDAMLGDVQQTLAAANELTGLTQARNNYGFLGYGQTVAVIDSGIAWDHPNLGAGFGSDYRVVGGWDFSEENDANPYDDGPSGAHGTHVAGIVGATTNSSGDEGVAPGVDLVALRVFNDQGAGYFGWVEKALRWVHTNRNAFANPITAVNLSLGTAWNAATVPSWAMLEDEFAQLKADGIFVSVSAGNSFTSYNQPGLSYPAASASVVPVMSVDDNGSLSYFSQRHERAIAAPGRTIRSTVPDYVGNQNGRTDDWASFSGTSMAAPYVAGASVLVREAMEFVGRTNITQDTIYEHMLSTADQIFDAATNTLYKRINVGAALDDLMPEDDFGSTTVAAFDLGAIGNQGAEISGTIGKRSDIDYFRFTASASGTVTFSATTSHYLDAVWTGDGVASGDGHAYTVNVVAGQSYIVGLSTATGVGHFQLDVIAETAFSFVDWGTIAQSEIVHLSANGESWYRVTASRAGIFTAETLSTSSGNVSLAWFDEDLANLSVAALNTGGQRVDQLVDGGQQLFLRVMGSGPNVGIRLTNLVRQTDSTLYVSGTAADDSVELSGRSAQTIVVNGVVYELGSNITQVVVDGHSGQDVVTAKAGSQLSLQVADVESVVDLDARAYSLDKDLGLRFSKSYYQNYSGFQEKWILGNQGWYIIAPNGSLYRATTSSTLENQPIIAHLDASYYVDPSLLHEAQLSRVAFDQQLVHQVASLNLHFYRSYFVNWGGMNEKWVLGNNRQWYFVTPDGNLYQWTGSANLGGSPIVAYVGAGCYDNLAMLQDAGSLGSFSASVAQQLNVTLNLHVQSSYATNWGGWNEKWIRGNGDSWYFITPTGGFYEWGRRGMSENRLLATLDVAFYATPSKLHESVAPLAGTAGVHAAFAAGADGVFPARLAGTIAATEASSGVSRQIQRRPLRAGGSGYSPEGIRPASASSEYFFALPLGTMRPNTVSAAASFESFVNELTIGDPSLLFSEADLSGDLNSESHIASLEQAFYELGAGPKR